MVGKEDILHLADLARIKVTDEEIPQLQTDINAIVEYVSVIQSLTTDGVIQTQLGARYNVLRTDEVRNEPGAHTADLLAAAPATDEQGYVKVHKILDTGNTDA